MIVSDSRTIRVVIIESQALFAKALCLALKSDPEFDIRGDADSVRSASLQKWRPDLVLLDLDGHPIDVEETMENIREQAPGARVCVLSAKVEPVVMRRVLAAGAEGYIVKDITLVELVRAMKTVAAGSSYVDPRIAGGLLRRAGTNERRTALYDLSDREVDIVRLIAEGLSNKEISGRLILSEKTVKNHISRIFSKLNISARTQAAVYAMKIGLA
jgi:DNA-binding NarL/FixJ family response regulator